MSNYESYEYGGSSSYDNNKRNKVSGMESSATFLPKVFGVMFIGLLATALLAGGLGYLFAYLFGQAGTAGDIELQDKLVSILYVGVIVCGIGSIILSIIIPIVCARGKHSVLIPLILYIICMGGLLTVFALFMDPWVLLEAAGITAISFGAIALIGLAGKGRIPGLGLVIMGLFIGIILLSVVNFILLLTGVINENDTLVWIVDFAFLALIMFVSIYDVRKINDIASSSSYHDKNTVLYCAFIMYSDVITIFIRIVYLLSKLKNK